MVEKIKKSLSGMPSSKTPGPDGFPAEFFRATWSILGTELSTTFLGFFVSPFMHKALNSTSLMLLQKRPGADEFKDYRLISCLNTVYKLITRLLADKLKAILPNLIVPNQTAFIKDRLPLENVLLASEVIKGYHKQNQSPRMTLIVDIAKAFDSSSPASFPTSSKVLYLLSFFLCEYKWNNFRLFQGKNRTETRGPALSFTVCHGDECSIFNAE